MDMVTGGEIIFHLISCLYIRDNAEKPDNSAYLWSCFMLNDVLYKAIVLVLYSEIVH